MKFEKLLGIELQEFFENHFEENLVFSSSEITFEKLKTPLPEWNQDLLERIILEGTISMVKDSLKVENDFFIDNGQVNLSKFFFLFGDGFTFYLKNVENFFPEVKDVINELQNELSPYKIQSNIFISPSGNIGFFPHFDCHDVVVMQISGSKHWKLWKAYKQDMTEERPSGKDASEVERIVQEQDPLIEKTLTENEVFYMPRGVVHAPAAKEDSVHMTFWLKAPLLETLDVKNEEEYERKKENYLYL